MLERNRRWIDLLKQAYSEWGNDKAPQLGAALAFYAMFSLTPLIVLLLSIISLIYGHSPSQVQIEQLLVRVVDKDTAESITTLLSISSRQTESSLFATFFSVASLTLTSSGAFIQLSESLNYILQADHSSSSGLKHQAVHFLRNNILMYFVILSGGALVGLSFLINLLIGVLSRYVSGLVHNGVIILLFQLLDLIISFGITTLLFALIYKIVPGKKLSNKAILAGSVFTAVLFSIGKFVLSYYLIIAAPKSTYAAAGSIFALLLWIYYSAQIFYFGAEFTKVYERS